MTGTTTGTASYPRRGPMPGFRDRAQRLRADFPLSFWSDGTAIAGRCVNISESGLFGEFAEELELWTQGELIIKFGEGVLGIRARVARTSGREAGFAFLPQNEAEREVIVAAVRGARATMGLQGEEAPF